MPVGEKCVADFGGADHLEYLYIEEVVTKGFKNGVGGHWLELFTVGGEGSGLF
jgi:hypothetical protein